MRITTVKLPVLSICAIVLITGCAEKTEVTVSEQPPLVEKISHDEIELTITATPPKVHLEKDILLTIKINSPSAIKISLPSIHDRLAGFILNGQYGGEPQQHSGKTLIEHHFRLTPLIAQEYRLAPIAITYSDHSVSPAVSGWFPTRPIVFETTSHYNGTISDDIDVSLTPLWIWPPLKRVLLYVVTVILIITACFFAWKLIKRIRREIMLRQMSPKERALLELEELLAKDLPAKQLVKQFYLELTMIVRRYIERGHSIKAPEQTTEEFLQAVSNDSRFSITILTTLKSFLEAADLVKFAAHKPSPEAIKEATGTARNYIAADSAAAEAQNE